MSPDSLRALVTTGATLFACAAFLLAQTAPTTVPAPTTAPATSVVTTAPVADDPEIERLVARLSDDNWKARHAAQNRLVTHGDAALPRLERLFVETSDPDVRERAGSTLKVIAENRQFGPSYVTLRFADAHPRKVFDELARQCQTEFATYPPDLWDRQQWPRVTFEADHEPFWAAMSRLSEQTGVEPQEWNERRALTLAQARSQRFSGPNVMSGAFFIVAQRVQRVQTIELGNNAADAKNPVRQDETSVQFIAFVEPKVRILRGNHQLHVEQAVDEHGNSLAEIPPGRIMAASYTRGNNWAWNLRAQLRHAPGAGTRLIRFKAKAEFTVVADFQTVELPLDAPGATRSAGPISVELKEIKSQGEKRYDLQLVLTHTGAARMDWDPIANSTHSGAVRVLDAKGHSLHHSGSVHGGDQTKRDVRLTFFRRNVRQDGRDELVGEPVSLVWEIPTATRQLEVPFEFNDLPLP